MVSERLNLIQLWQITLSAVKKELRKLAVLLPAASSRGGLPPFCIGPLEQADLTRRNKASDQISKKDGGHDADEETRHRRVGTRRAS
jgi:hypothetical protein